MRITLLVVIEAVSLVVLLVLIATVVIPMVAPAPHLEGPRLGLYDCPRVVPGCR